MRRILLAISCLVAIGALVGCSRGKPQTADPLRASRWLVTSFIDRNGDLPIPTEFIPHMDIDDETLSFVSTCNTLPMEARFEDGQIEVGMMVIRGVGCGEAVSQAAYDLEDAVLEAMPGWSTYTLKGDELIISFDGGEIRFSRVMPPNAAGLRAFPVRRPGDAKPTYDNEGLQRGPIRLQNGCLRVGVSNSGFTSYLIVWPPQYAAAFDDETAWATWRGESDIRVGDEVVMSGGRLLELEPIVDADVLRLGSIPAECPGPYWVMEDVEVIITATP